MVLFLPYFFYSILTDFSWAILAYHLLRTITSIYLFTFWHKLKKRKIHTTFAHLFSLDAMTQKYYTNSSYTPACASWSILMLSFYCELFTRQIGSLLCVWHLTLWWTCHSRINIHAHFFSKRDGKILFNTMIDHSLRIK